MSTSFLTNAHDFHIGSLTVSTPMAVASTAFEHLQNLNNIAADAIHNSDERCDTPNCHPETRLAVQKEIRSWITDGDDDDEPKRILWLTGPAGSGKTAIAGSVAEACEDEGLLAGSFFFSSFSGSDNRRSKRHLIATLAYSFLQHDALQPLRQPILSTIERDPTIFRKSLSAQAKLLLLKPFQSVGRQLDQSQLPKVVVIDGLDEVEAPKSRDMGRHEARSANEAEQLDILRTLLLLTHNAHFPFRILIASRDEPAIRDYFSHDAAGFLREVFLDEKYGPDSDILLFFNAKFGEIRRRYKLSPQWPGEEALERLLRNASGQFVYAATVLRYLQTSKEPPQARLERILQSCLSGFGRGNHNVFSSLDRLYTHILESSPDVLLAIRWLAVIGHPQADYLPATFVRQILEEQDGQTDYLLGNLTSLISIPPREDHTSSFQYFHKSLHDYLRNPERCGHEFFDSFGDAIVYSDLQMRCVHIIKARSPAVPLTDRGWQIFLSHLTTLWSLALDYHDGLHILECDAVWWVGRVTASFLDQPQEASFIIAYLFDLKHLPTNLAVWVYTGMQTPEKSYPQSMLEMGMACTKRRCVASPPEGKIPSPLNSPSVDYDSMCSSADMMFHSLPCDWRERYDEELCDGKSVYNALQPVIREIPARDPDLRDLEDIDEISATYGRASSSPSATSNVLRASSHLSHYEQRRSHPVYLAAGSGGSGATTNRRDVAVVPPNPNTTRRNLSASIVYVQSVPNLGQDFGDGAESLWECQKTQRRR
ncbi:hypothetical protein NMY22_g10949 [Coprinellus aureogranulatus]|nr:hypothetical protein NMY22_g10949 [Coprinellus aureogranulatus]